MLNKMHPIVKIKFNGKHQISNIVIRLNFLS